jgi:hypothetical protein
MRQVIFHSIAMKLPTTKLRKIRPPTRFQKIQEGRFFRDFLNGRQEWDLNRTYLKIADCCRSDNNAE